jgi:hypothetical protein
MSSVLGRSGYLDLSYRLGFSIYIEVRGTARGNASALVVPSTNLPQSVPFRMSIDFAQTVTKRSDVFYPSPFLPEISGPAAQAPNGFSTLMLVGLGVGLLILLSLSAIVFILHCRRRGMAALRVSRSVEYSDRQSDDSSDEQILGFNVDAGKPRGKSTWSDSESESDDVSI